MEWGLSGTFYFMTAPMLPSCKAIQSAVQCVVQLHHSNKMLNALKREF